MTEVNINSFEEELVRRGKGSEALESMLARFNRAVQGSGIFKELKECERYEKPSDRKRRKHREALIRMRKGKDGDAVHRTGKTKTTRPHDRTIGIQIQ